MDKIWIVAAREYRVRVRNKWFIVGTLLTPIVFSLFFVIPLLSARLTEKEQLKIWVIDPTGVVFPELSSTSGVTFHRSDKPFEALRAELADTTGQAILVLPSDLTKRQLTATLYAPKSPSLLLERDLNQRLRTVLERRKLIQAGVAPEQLSQTELAFDFQTAKLTSNGTQQTSTLLATGVGYVMAFLVYLMMAIYGQVVLLSVMEEKTNRIVEVIASSVKPIQLMIGKIAGIGAVGVTQAALWIVLMGILLTGFLALAGPEAATQGPELDPEQLAQAERLAVQIRLALEQFNPSLVVFFLIYFVGGYLIFGSLFGAVGSAVDQPQDASQFSSLVVLPLIIPMLVLAPILQNPSSGLAIGMSLVPYFSPIIMMVRLAATDVPFWQLVLSLVLLALGVYVNGWLAAKVYRVGILAYGKKPTYRELARWIVQRG